MSPEATLEVVFIASLLCGLLGMIASIGVQFGLERRGVEMGWRRSMPTYLLRRCRELPHSPENARLVRLAKWSLMGFLIAMIGAGITGPMLAG